MQDSNMCSRRDIRLKPGLTYNMVGNTHLGQADRQSVPQRTRFDRSLEFFCRQEVDAGVSAEGWYRCCLISRTSADGKSLTMRCVSVCSATFSHSNIVLGLNCLDISIAELPVSRKSIFSTQVGIIIAYRSKIEKREKGE